MNCVPGKSKIGQRAHTAKKSTYGRTFRRFSHRLFAFTGAITCPTPEQKSTGLHSRQDGSMVGWYCALSLSKCPFLRRRQSTRNQESTSVRFEFLSESWKKKAQFEFCTANAAVRVFYRVLERSEALTRAPCNRVSGKY
jgi:hypothetical protein